VCVPRQHHSATPARLVAWPFREALLCSARQLTLECRVVARNGTCNRRFHGYVKQLPIDRRLFCIASKVSY
jgi:hypothetical protein